ncbi:hypothetical protein OG984_02730 [Nocardioides sp. NBC_00368]|uniref:hypothetical protein n=1 Tax=Nocardioides sp. NBC_00368 TaxID=2976000 RepID=UPI002E1D9AB1
MNVKGRVSMLQKLTAVSAQRWPRSPRGALLEVGWFLGLVTLLAVALLAASAGPIQGDEEDDGKYSFYRMSSNLTAYFSNTASPDSDDGTATLRDGGYDKILHTPSEAGAMLGYSDPDMSLSLDWLTSQLSGSSSSVGYDTLTAHDGDGRATDDFEGVLDYAHFGAANSDLGFDSVGSGLGGGFVHTLAGGLVWFLYAIAAGVPLLFGAVIDILKILNPFRWLYLAVAAINPTFAEGMSGGQHAPGPLGGLANWIGSWYGALTDISWNVLVPVFIALFVVSILLFKKIDKGSALKRLIVRVMFIGVGLPLLGSMYTSTLGALDDSVKAENVGATKVVLSTYVDFETWANGARLRIPEGASISWDAGAGHAKPVSTMSVRNSALLINKQSHPQAFRSIHAASATDDPYLSWSSNSITPDTGNGGGAGSGTGGASAFFTTLSMLSRYMASETVEASSFETQAKGDITQNRSVDADAKEGWFTAYGDSGDMDSPDPAPNDNPVISTRGSGLYSDNKGGMVKTFKSNTTNNCGYRVTTDGRPMNCNLSPLSLYNYLNTSFRPTSMVMYSSDKATSGFTREQHHAVSQVGSGPTSFMYWVNTVVILSSIILVGISYACGMLWNSLKRTFETISAIPFAMLGAIGAIAKVIIYVTALILEVLITLFLYQFVSQLLVSLPSIVEGPLAAATKSNPLLSRPTLGPTAVVLLTFFSSLFVIVFTISAMRARKSVLNALNETVTKLIEKFLEVQAVAPGPAGAGALPSLASGLAAGGGMAAANRLMGGAPKRPGAPPSAALGGPDGGAGGPRPGGPGGPAGGSGPGRPGSPDPHASGTAHGLVPGERALPGGGASADADRSGSDKELAAKVTRQGGLSRIGTGMTPATGNGIANGAASRTASRAAGGAMRGGVPGAAAGVAGGVMASKTLGKNASGQRPGSTGGSTENLNGRLPAGPKALPAPAPARAAISSPGSAPGSGLNPSKRPAPPAQGPPAGPPPATPRPAPRPAPPAGRPTAAPSSPTRSRAGRPPPAPNQPQDQN